MFSVRENGIVPIDEMRGRAMGGGLFSSVVGFRGASSKNLGGPPSRRNKSGYAGVVFHFRFSPPMLL